MWVFTTAGFVSAVEHRQDKDMLMVRARDEKALEFMLSSIELAGKALAEEGSEVKVEEDLKIVSSSKGDYRHRVVMSKATFALYLQFEVLNYLAYPNFKSALGKVRGPEYTRAAHRVWDDMLGVSDGPQLYGSVGKGGSRVPKKYPTYPAKKGEGKGEGAGSFVGSTFFADEWEDGVHGFHEDGGQAAALDAEWEDHLEAGSYRSQYEEAEAQFDVLPAGSEGWTEEEFDAYLDSIAPHGQAAVLESGAEPEPAAEIAKTAKKQVS